MKESMKEYIIAFALALLATAWVFDTGGPPQLAGIRVGDGSVRETAHTDAIIRDEQYGDFLYSDSEEAKMKARTAVIDSGDRNDTMFPIRGTGI